MHATAVTCLNTGQQNRFQAALWRLLSDDHRFRYIVGYPEPRWEAHNRQVLLHTVLRREAFVTGSVIDFSQVSINDFPEAMQFLSNLNGDWTKPVIHFYTAGRPITEPEARELVYASFIAMDVLQANTKEPSIDDWCSCGAACGLTAFGILCHEVLPQIVELARITWNQIPLPNDLNADDAALDGATAERIKGRKKAWRTKCFLENPARKLNAVLLSFLGVAVEHLMLRLDYLDSRHNGILDLASARLCPFRACRRWLAQVLASGFSDGAPLAPVYRHFHERPLRGNVDVGLLNDSLISEAARTMGFDMGSQVFWRYLHMRELPFTLVDCVHLG